MDLHHPVVCVVGPTASGKTAFSQDLAYRLDAEIISADSMQIYTGMDIGTGKPKPEERKVAHFGFDLVDPGEPYSVALFQEYARSCIAAIDSREKTAMLVGGTGFYLRAAIDDYQFPSGDQTDNPVRLYYQKIAQEQGSKAVWELLHEKDPSSAALIPLADTKRVIRAFELLDAGCTYAEQKSKLQTISQLYPACFLGLAVDPAILAQRIDSRVEKMVEEGLLDETQRLLDKGFETGLTAPQAIGYSQMLAVIRGEMSLTEAKERIKTATRRYAKRQRTWFRKDKRIYWIDASSFHRERMLADALKGLTQLGFFSY